MSCSSRRGRGSGCGTSTIASALADTLQNIIGWLHIQHNLFDGLHQLDLTRRFPSGFVGVGRFCMLGYLERQIFRFCFAFQCFMKM